jgi:hypothetical protein
VREDKKLTEESLSTTRNIIGVIDPTEGHPETQEMKGYRRLSFDWPFRCSSLP